MPKNVNFTVQLPPDAVLLTIEELAELLGVSESTVKQVNLYEGGPPRIYLSGRTPRFPLSGVIKWIKSIKPEQGEGPG